MSATFSKNRNRALQPVWIPVSVPAVFFVASIKGGAAAGGQAPAESGKVCCNFQNDAKRAFSFEKIQCLRRLTREGIPERVSRSWHLAFRSVALVLKTTALSPDVFGRCRPSTRKITPLYRPVFVCCRPSPQKNTVPQPHKKAAKRCFSYQHSYQRNF